MSDVIRVEGLCKKYRFFELDNVSFSVPEGCVAGFIGVNGQGKTTTIKNILGLSVKDAGKIEILGMDMDEQPGEIKDMLGVVFDEGYFYEKLKMKDMKKLIARAYSRWDDDKYRELMERFELNEEQHIESLSKGMKMKFALALAMSHHAKLLIMDEPTSGLDPLVRKQFLDLLREYMAEEGRGIIYSTHITSDLDKFADVLVFIDHGRIMFTADKDELLDSHMTVQGDSKYLSEENRKLFIDLIETSLGFTGLTKEADALGRVIPGMVSRRANIEEIMIGYIEGGRKRQC